MIDKCLIYR